MCDLLFQILTKRAGRKPSPLNKETMKLELQLLLNEFISKKMDLSGIREVIDALEDCQQLRRGIDKRHYSEMRERDLVSYEAAENEAQQTLEQYELTWKVEDLI